eukprot:176251_1
MDVDDEVELTKNRIGVIRYKGPLEGKNGIFYGVELSQGTGKHSGLFKGQRYFMSQKDKGVFVRKKQILYKLQASGKKDEKKKKKKKKGDTGSSAKGPGRVDRKGGPRDEKKPKKKGKSGCKSQYGKAGKELIESERKLQLKEEEEEEEEQKKEGKKKKGKAKKKNKSEKKSKAQAQTRLNTDEQRYNGIGNNYGYPQVHNAMKLYYNAQEAECTNPTHLISFVKK